MKQEEMRQAGIDIDLIKQLCLDKMAVVILMFSWRQEN